jgi:uncharacterized RDD family membrane protein YckC
MPIENFYSTEQESHLDDIVDTPDIATKNIRFWNLVIDSIVIYLLNHLLTIIIISSINGAGSLLILELFYLFTNFLYYFFMESVSGKTIGKLITGTKVVTQDSNKPTTKQIALRSLSRLVPFEPFSFFSESGWHDRWSDTIVVKNK